MVVFSCVGPNVGHFVGCLFVLVDSEICGPVALWGRVGPLVNGRSRLLRKTACPTRRVLAVIRAGVHEW